jgi:hypothetical protein
LGDVLDEDHRAASGAEGFEKLRHVLLGTGVVAIAPVVRLVETVLDVDEEEDGVARQVHESISGIAVRLRLRCRDSFVVSHRENSAILLRDPYNGGAALAIFCGAVPVVVGAVKSPGYHPDVPVELGRKRFLRSDLLFAIDGDQRGFTDGNRGLLVLHGC